MKLANQRMVLTGAASGIGLAVLQRLAGLPVQVLAVDLNAAALQAACDGLAGQPGRLTPYACDLSQPENLDRLFEDATAALGGVDVFIANAGFAYYEEIARPDWAHIQKIYCINVFSAIYALEKMQALNGERPFKMVMTASAMAHIGVPGYAIYSSTKAALDRFADAYRWQMKDPRKLMLVYPIATRTKFFAAAGKGTPTPWPSQTPEDFAYANLRGIQRDALAVYPSRVFRLILLAERLFPPMRWIVQRQEQRRLAAWKAARQ